jgi:hypothetical protein
MSSPEYWLGRGGGFLGSILGGLFQRGASKNYARSFDTLRTNSKHRKELQALRALYGRLDREPGALEKKRTLLVQQVLMEAGDPQTTSPQITESITKLLTECLSFEGTFAVPETSGKELSIGEIWELRDRLSRLVAIVERPEAINRLSGTLRGLIRNLLPNSLPMSPEGKAATLTVPIYALLPDPALSVEGALGVFLNVDPLQSGDSSELAPRLPCKGKSVRNRGVSQTMPFLVIPRSLLRGGFIQLSPRFAKLLRGTCCESPVSTQHAPSQARNNS